MTSVMRPISSERAAAIARLDGQLREQVERTETRLRELESTLADLLRDRGTIQEDRDAAQRVVDSVRADLRLFSKARARIDEGRYGFCAGCAAEIPIERLEAIPTADRCARCV